MSSKPRLFGADYSVYIRIARLVLLERTSITNWSPSTSSLRRPTRLVRALEYDGFCLFETSAIARYVDEAFEGQPLQPSAPQQRARLKQIICLLDAYAYRSMVWGIYVERVFKPKEGKTPTRRGLHPPSPSRRLAFPRCRALSPASRKADAGPNFLKPG